MNKTRSGNWREEQAKRRIAGRSYQRRKSKEQVDAKRLPSVQATCKCQYQCKTIASAWKTKLFADYHNLKTENAQGTYLLGLLHICEIGRRRHGNYEDVASSRRQCTVRYVIPSTDGGVTQVCKQTFQDIYGVKHRFLQTLQARKKQGISLYEDQRGRNPKRKCFNDNNCRQVINHINSFPRDESHYGRAKSSKEYLSPDLNIHRMFQAFKTDNPEGSVSYKYYRSVFKKHFPNLSFHRPRTDTCRTCDELKYKILANDNNSHQAKIQQTLHHKQYKRAMELMALDSADSKLPNHEFSVVSMDLQQVLPVPSLTHSNMYYSRQLNCYNLGIHISDNNEGLMCLWDETVAARGSCEIASCLLKVFNQGLITRKKLIIWSDNCAGQNKNKTMMFLMIFLVAHGWFEEITQKFLISGHSFLSCDRDFAMIEKRRKRCKAFVPSDLHKIIETAKNQNPFHVIPMTNSCFFDLKAAADTFLNTTKCNISKCAMIKVSARNPQQVAFKKTFSEVEAWQEIDVLKRGKNVADLKATLLSLKEAPVLTQDKKNDLAAMVPFLPQEHKAFYEQICTT